MTTTLTVDLAAMDDETFRDHVLEVIEANRRDEAWQSLIADDMCFRTRQAIGELVQELHDAASERKQTEPKHVYAAWLLDTMRPMQTVLQRRLNEARLADRQREDQRHRERAEEGRSVARQLGLAVHQHRLALIAAGLAPEPHDRALWGLLAQLRISFNDGDLTLDEAIGRNWWRPKPGDAS